MEKEIKLTTLERKRERERVFLDMNRESRANATKAILSRCYIEACHPSYA